MSDKEKFFEEELKPCPWCGTDEYLEFKSTDDTDRFTVLCNFRKGGCGSTNGYDNRSQQEAAQKWNNRRLYNE